MQEKLKYAVIRPGEVYLCQMESETVPTLEELADRVAAVSGFEDRDGLMEKNPELVLGWCLIH